MSAIRFHFDFISPYAYLAWTQIHAIAARHGREVRKAQALGVPVAPPPAHPFNPLLALRVASVAMDAAQRRALIDRIYAAVWSGEARDVEDRATIEGLLAEVGLDAARTVDDALSAEGKARVRTQTERAIADGVFGVPTAICDGELFWGVESLPDLQRFLVSGAPTVDGETFARWAAMKPSAERPRR